MNYKKLGILFPILFLVFFLLPLNKTVLAADTTIPSPGDPSEIQNVKKIIGENTPTFIANPIVAMVNGIEGWRASTSLIIENQRVQIKAEIKALDDEAAQNYTLKALDFGPAGDNVNLPNTLGHKNSGNQLSKIWKYIELFFLYIVSVILGFRLVFYAIILIIFILILRSIWRLVF